MTRIFICFKTNLNHKYIEQKAQIVSLELFFIINLNLFDLLK